MIGVISDTHGLLRPEALEALRGSRLILHAGDIGSAEILTELRSIAPVVAVRGNTDRAPWARQLSWTEAVEIDGRIIYLLHDLKCLDLDPRAAGFSVVISGHSHFPEVESREDVLFLNPGSAGPKRFHCPLSVGRLSFSNGEIQGEILPSGFETWRDNLKIRKKGPVLTPAPYNRWPWKIGLINQVSSCAFFCAAFFALLFPCASF